MSVFSIIWCLPIDVLKDKLMFPSIRNNIFKCSDIKGWIDNWNLTKNKVGMLFKLFVGKQT